jgi:PKD repeat protein
MASPHVAGAAARYLETNPGATPAAVASALTSNATLNKIPNAGTGSANRLLYTGFMDGPANQPPDAQFTFSCTGLTCTFDSSGSTDDVGITSRQWRFGDGTTAGNVVATTKTYAAAGTYTVRLSVADGQLFDFVDQAVTVTSGGGNQPPVARFTFSCTNLTCSFDSSTSTDDVGIVNRSWAFGDGATAGNVVTTSCTYAAAGTYNVTLTVTDGGGLSNSITQAVTVTAPANQPPDAQYTFSCTGLTCSFDSSSSTDDVGITARQWNFGDGTSAANVVAPTKTYAAPGTYTVRLSVADAGMLFDTITKQVTVTAPEQ